MECDVYEQDDHLALAYSTPKAMIFDQVLQIITKV